MRKTFGVLLALAIVALLAGPLATPAHAAEEGTTAGATTGGWGLPLVGATLGLGLAAGLCGLGQSKAIVAACEGIARNPGAGGAIRTAMLLGLAFIESLVIYMLVIAFVKV